MGPRGGPVPRPAGPVAGAGEGPRRRAVGGRASTGPADGRDGHAAATGPTGAATRAPSRAQKLSKDAYRRQKAVIDDDLTRLGLRKGHLELALHDPSIAANFVELRRVTSELADVEQALAAAEEAWLLLEERAP